MIDDKEALNNIGDNILALLDQRNLSQSELSRISGEHVMTVSRVCRKVSIPHVITLLRLAQALGVSTDYLILNRMKKIQRAS